MAKTEKTISIKPIAMNTVTITIEGDGDLILNQMNAPTKRELIDKRNDKSKTIKERNKWEEIITAIHWRDGAPETFTEDSLNEALENNAPCITTFGLKKSFEEAVVRNELDKYSTKFRNGVNVVGKGGLVPIRFTEHHIDEKLMSPKKGAPVLSRQNRFSGWSADITIQYVDGGAYSLEQIVQIVGLAGFGGGIGSGRSSGYGRYHVVGAKVGF